MNSNKTEMSVCGKTDVVRLIMQILSLLIHVLAEMQEQASAGVNEVVSMDLL